MGGLDRTEHYIKVDDAMRVIEGKDNISHDDIMLVKQLMISFQSRNHWIPAELFELTNRKEAIESKWRLQNNS